MKVSSIRVKVKTLFRFNVLKVLNSFASADYFLNYLLNFFEDNSKTNVKPLNRKVYKEYHLNEDIRW